MPRTRFAKRCAASTPYWRKAIGKKALATAATSLSVFIDAGHSAAPPNMGQLGIPQQSDKRAPRFREPSFAAWEQMSDEDIARVTQALDQASWTYCWS